MQRYANIKPSGGDTSAPLNLMKRIKLIQRHGSVRGKKILDCGCGTGQYVSALLAAGADSHGIEFFKDKIGEARQRHPEIAARVFAGNIEEMDFSGNSFDAVLLNEVLEHITDQTRALSKIARVLSPKGSVLFFPQTVFIPLKRTASRSS